MSSLSNMQINNQCHNPKSRHALPTLEAIHLIRTNARHQINVIPIGSTKSPPHTFSPPPVQWQRRFPKESDEYQLSEAREGTLTALNLRQLPLDSDHLTPLRMYCLASLSAQRMLSATFPQLG